MRRLLLSAISLFSLIYPQLLYGNGNQNEQIDLWQIFCAHRLMAQESAPLSDSGAMVMFEDEQWNSLVADLDLRTMPTAFKKTPENLDAWLRCENEYSDSFESAEFLSRGRRHFSLASVNSDGAELYSERWKDFVAGLQKSVTVPKPRNTISMRSR